MGESKIEMLKSLAQGVFDDAIVEPVEFISVPGNTVEKYVDGLMENFVDASDMTKEDVTLLRQMLKELFQKSIEENSGT